MAEDRLKASSFYWPVASSAAADVGLEILVLDEDGQFKADYQFIEA